MNQITLLVKVNLALGWVAIAAVLLWRVKPERMTA